MYATVAVARKDPREIWCQLSTIDLRLLDELAFLARLRSKESPTHAPWCHPGRVYLAKRLRCSVVTISRHVSRLRSLGVLDSFQPRPRGGIWRTNVYRLLSRQVWRMARIRVLIERVAHRTLRRVHYSPQETAKCIKSDTRLEFDQLLARWTNRGKATEPAAST